MRLTLEACETCARMTALLVTANRSANVPALPPCPDCGRIVYAPREGETWGLQNCAYPGQTRKEQ